MTRRRADPKTAHLPLIGFREIEAGKIELARAILAVGEDEALPALQVLTAMNRAKVIAEPLPYLAVREDPTEDGAIRRVIVIRHNLPRRVEKSTELDAGKLTTEMLEDQENWPPAASKKIDEYAEDRRFRRQAATAPQDIRIATVLKMYVKLRDPKNISPEAQELREFEARLGGETSPWTGFVNATNFSAQLIEYFQDGTLGQINKNTGKNYKTHVQARPKKRGGVDDEGKTIAVPQDSSVDAHLSLFNVSLTWFIREYQPPIRIEFDKPVVEVGVHQVGHGVGRLDLPPQVPRSDRGRARRVGLDQQHGPGPAQRQAECGSAHPRRPGRRSERDQRHLSGPWSPGLRRPAPCRPSPRASRRRGERDRPAHQPWRSPHRVRSKPSA